MSPQSSSIFHLWIPRKALKTHNCGLKRRPTWRISFLERLRRKDFFRANLPRETLNFNKVVTHFWNQLTTLSIQRQEKNAFRNIPLYPITVLSWMLKGLDQEGILIHFSLWDPVDSLLRKIWSRKKNSVLKWRQRDWPLLWSPVKFYLP